MPPADRVCPVLVSPAWLMEHSGRVRIVDVRWRLGKPGAGLAAYAAGHLPGAVYLDVDRDLAAPVGTGPGRHPLPSAESFAETMQRIGVSDETIVVAYDDAGGAVAARLWFLLRYFGHETGAVLDGGIQAFSKAGGALSTAEPAYARGTFAARPRRELVVDRAFVADNAPKDSVWLLDARLPERYRGEREPIDPRAGHIPGAVSVPFALNLTSVDGPFLPKEELSRRLGHFGDKPVVCYCGSGVTACHDLLALELADVNDARLYEGSWSDWSSMTGAEVATGETPSGHIVRSR